MLVAAAVLPHPPLLVPEVAGAAAAELEPLRAACRRAVGSVLARRPDLVVLVGSGPDDGEYPADAVGSLGGFGIGVTVRLDGAAPTTEQPPVLPLSLTIGGWLLGGSGWTGRVVGRSTAPDLSPGDAAALGADLAGKAARVGLLVMGDGAVHRSERASGYPEVGGEAFATTVAAALAAADIEQLSGLDAGLARRLQAAGRGPWQVLAGAAAASGIEAGSGDAVADAKSRVTTEVLDRSSPYGVDYLVVTWLLADSA